MEHIPLLLAVLSVLNATPEVTNRWTLNPRAFSVTLELIRMRKDRVLVWPVLRVNMRCFLALLIAIYATQARSPTPPPRVPVCCAQLVPSNA
jgi:hypothetical protein